MHKRCPYEEEYHIYNLFPKIVSEEELTILGLFIMVEDRAYFKIKRINQFTEDQQMKEFIGG